MNQYSSPEMDKLSVVKIIRQCLSRYLQSHSSSRLLVAYSGGIDSSVLLHSIVQLKLPDTQLLAIHVNHHLHADSDQWEKHCQEQARVWNCHFLSVQVTVPSKNKQSPEEAARIARYRAFSEQMRAGDLLLTAHHADDQAETLLLQLLRGSGPHGLAAMPESKSFASGYLLRPMLEISRVQIQEYARTQGLHWITDSDNDNLRFDRNYIRHQVGPILDERWPQWKLSFGRAARHQQSILPLIEQTAQQLLETHQNEDQTLSVIDCLLLSDADKKLLLRQWINIRGLRLPNEKQTKHLIQMFLSQPSNSGGQVSWQGGQVRRYRGKLYAMEPLSVMPNDFEREWPRNTDLDITELNTTLRWEQLLAQAPDCEDIPMLTVRLRRGGEKCAWFNGNIHRPLKKIFQELGIPPWMRDRTPLIYVDNELKLLWNLMVCR